MFSVFTVSSQVVSFLTGKTEKSVHAAEYKSSHMVYLMFAVFNNIKVRSREGFYLGQWAT